MFYLQVISLLLSLFMKIKLLVIGKTAADYLDSGISIYTKRLVHYVDFSIQVVPDIKTGKTTDPARLKEQEAQAFMKLLTNRDFVVLLDENGRKFSSVDFAGQLNKWMMQGDKNLVFVIGGAFGFGEELIKKSSFSMSLSSMTFSHQMVRLIFVEQLYRAFTILKGEPYHHK